MGERTVVIGTRGSRLALAQADLVRRALLDAYPHLRWEVEVIRTSGDRATEGALASAVALGGKGIFIKEIEEALLAGRIDMAVHSLKDVPTELPRGLTLSAFLERGDPRDVLIYGQELPERATIGTGSPRRGSQLRALRPGWRIEELRGNVETRIEKVKGGRYDAVVLAACGLARLGLLEHVSEYLPSATLLPAVGQAVIAIETRADDRGTHGLIEPLDDEPTRTAVLAERTFLQLLGGGCRAPITAYGWIEDGRLALDGMVATPDGARLIRDRLTGSPRRPREIAHRLVDRLIGQGAEEVLSAVRDPS